MKTRPARLLVVGFAHCLPADLDRLGVWDGDYMAINRAGLWLSRPIQHWTSYHPAEFAEWMDYRSAFGGNPDCELHAHVNGHERIPGVQYHDFSGGNERTGGSGLLGVLVGLALGYERIVVAGAPLDDGSRLDKFVSAGHYHEYRLGWQDRYEQIKDRVRSMSGWTRDLLGEPTHQFLEGPTCMAK